jgi:hypothetical protein
MLPTSSLSQVNKKIIVSPAGESEDDPNTDNQHHALEPAET